MLRYVTTCGQGYVSWSVAVDRRCVVVGRDVWAILWHILSLGHSLPVGPGLESPAPVPAPFAGQT